MKLCLFAIAAVCAAQPVVIRTGTLIDGKGGVQRNVNVVVEGSKIVRVDPGGHGRASYDLSSMTLMPGWIDTHVHPSWHFKNDRLVEGEESLDQQMLYTAANAQATLRAGFTTVQSVGARIDKPLRDVINSGVIEGPRILTSIYQINENSGSPEQIRQIVRKGKQEGADLVKIFATKSIREGGGISMTLDQIAAACGEAKAQGLRAVVHAHASDGAQAVIRAGCTGIEHGTFLDNATLDLMKERGIYFDPNFLVLHNYLDNKPKFLGIGNYNEEGFAYMEKGLPMVADVIRRARAKGVMIVLGTDAVAGSHGRNYEEFVYRVKDGGEKPMDVLMSGTSVAAASLGLGNVIGTVAPGFEADLVAIQGNPLDDITAVRHAAFVMKGGKLVRYDPVRK